MLSEAMNDLICYLHVGTHKTGTTTIQDVLTRDPAVLATHGLYVPLAGRFGPLGGHHNIEEELSGNPNYDPSHGDLATIVREIAECGLPTVVISSENLEHLFTRPEALERMRREIEGAGYEARVIVYLRGRFEYARSLYAELVKHGLRDPFDTFLHEIVTTGAFTIRVSGRIFPFEYARLLDGFADVFGRERVVVRRYERDRPPDYIVRDFFSLVGWSPDAIATLGEISTINVTAHDAVNASPDTQPRNKLRAIRRFSADRSRVSRDYGIDVPVASGLINNDRRLRIFFEQRARDAVIRPSTVSRSDYGDASDATISNPSAK